MSEQRPVVDWEGEKSGFDDFEITVTGARFGKHPRFRNGEENAFIMTGTVKLPEGKVIEDSEQFWGIGKFDAIDGGKRVVHESGDDGKFFHSNSGYIALLTAARKVGAPIEERCDHDPLNARNAEIWLGLKMRMQRLDTGKTFTGDEGEQVNLRRLVPVEYLGEVDGSGSVSSNSQPSGVDLESLAKSHTDQMAFIDEAVKAGFDVGDADAAWKAAKS